MARELNLKLPSADDLFSTQEERDDAQREKIVILPIAEIDDFPDHPYPVEMDEEMQKTVESVKDYGVHTPALVRLKEDGRYEMVSGHRRKMASELTGRDTMPCIVRQMSHDMATIIMVDSNIQREKIPPSVKGKAYKMKLDAIRREAGRPTKEKGLPQNSLSKNNYKK
jgi:ParB family chromosome partitioning protein